MAQVQLILSSKHRKSAGKRSRTGCRTCRIRRIKCDESPGQCNNCVSANWTCDGYDAYRLPQRRGLQDIGTRLGWMMTSDEHRCYSYFQYRSVTNLAGFFDSPLWQQLALQMSRTDPAVFHAVNMLSAAHQESELHNMQISARSRIGSQQYYFSLQQSTRAIALLNQRRNSQDPQLRQTILLCCLLFVLFDVLVAQYDSAFTHLHGGLRILKELEIQGKLESEVEPSIVAAFRRLDTQASLYDTRFPILSLEYGNQSPLKLFEAPTGGFTSLSQVREKITVLFTAGIPLVARSWSLNGPNMETNYESLYQSQRRLLDAFAEFDLHFTSFRVTKYHQLSEKEQLGADITYLLYLGHTLTLKTVLIRGPVPESLVPEFLALLQAHEDMIEKLKSVSGLVMDHVMIAHMYLVATQCPDVGIRIRAIRLLRSWPHYEGLHSSNVTALMALGALKRDFPNEDKALSMLQTTDAENEFLVDSLESIKNGVGEPTIPLFRMSELPSRP
ncbi:transcriptional regulator family: Fungal Specific TF [Aspergillus niger]|nr:transcriptional regulator family: Fungal Specific TF [Aspergillus niger]KAI2859112.1 transcriptional regulator family: Fungal Specific TF [Aspergillus niger]KAI2933373.1 transcriptional regulator family: Fungal Specific TF [Aspergillus niger]KAI2940676.1 transcriptional regulator family: Fungal Specific TF [Aspergillus niger]KAI2969251.1 transcriptional regulator family: Fungal Specific TF [Aspergillus niger]